jgi:4a-hydroxytetrahydrobiopterin dehydratase
MGIPLKDEEVDQSIAALEYWKRNGKTIEREYKFDDFLQALRFVNRVAEVAEEANHHPNIHINYNRVMLGLTSHDSGGVTARDIQLAVRINKLKA